MFRSMFRVLVVVSVVLCLTILAVPSAQAGPGGAKAPVVRSTDGQGLLQAAVAWLLGVPKLKAPRSTTAASKNPKPTNGSCIDPNGRPIPCP